jgi:anti-sigma factor RsiW
MSWGMLTLTIGSVQLPADARSAILDIESATSIVANAMVSEASAALVAYDDAADIDAVAHVSTSEGEVRDSLRVLLGREAWGRQDDFVDFNALSMSISAVQLLEQRGVVHSRRDEFGELQIALRPSAAAFQDDKL